MLYICNLCTYSTNRLPDINRHKNSTKHKNNVEIFGEELVNNVTNNDIPICTQLTHFDDKSFLCECGKTFAYKQGLSFHRKNTCKLTKEKNLEQIKQEENETINTMKSQINSLLEIMKSHQIVPNMTASEGSMITTNTNNNNTNSNNTNTLNNNKMYSVNVMSYVTNNFKNAKPLEQLKTTDVHTFLEHGKMDGYSIEEAMIFYYQKKSFSQFIGEAIKTEYKKSNQEEQKFWASDVARLTFIVRRVLTKTKKKKENVWIKDPNGTSLLNLLIIPSLTEIKQVLSIYIDECAQKIKHLDNYMVEKIGNNIFEANKIINDINLHTFEKPILRYIAPHFQLKLADNELLN